MSEDREDHPEPSPEPEPDISSQPEEVVAAVPLDDLVIRILDEQAALGTTIAGQLQLVLDEVRHVADVGNSAAVIEHLRAVREGLRVLSNDLAALTTTVRRLADGQAAILEVLRVIPGLIGRTDARVTTVEQSFERWVAAAGGIKTMS